MRKLVIVLILLICLLAAWLGIQKYFSLNKFLGIPQLQTEKVKVVSEESVTIADVKKVGPSVVTVEELIVNAAK